MNADFLRYRGLLAAAVGAGVVLGAAGIFLYHQLYAERRRLLLQRDLARLDVTVTEMRLELNAMRKLGRSKQKGSIWKNKSRSMPAIDHDHETETDMFSTVGTDDGDDEFFDFSDEEEMLFLHKESDGAHEEESDPRLVQLFFNVDHLFKGRTDEKKAAYSLLLEHQQQFPPNVGLLWRLAKSCHNMANMCDTTGDPDGKKDYILQGCSFAQQALEMDDTNSEAHKWFAVMVGSRGEFLGTREKIEDGFVFKQHVDKALLLRPSDPSLHHLLGRFKFEVATLSWLERKLASTLFAELPEATYSEALAEFLHAEELSPVPWKENRLLVAKCHICQGNMTEALEWLDRAAEVPISSVDDEAAEREVQDLLIKYRSYRKNH